MYIYIYNIYIYNIYIYIVILTYLIFMTTNFRDVFLLFENQ